jgi:hypothetical protein
MAELMSMEEAKSHFASKGTGNAGLTLGIIGTALGALGAMNNGWLNGNGILGLGGWGNNNGASAALTGAAVGASLADNNWAPSPCELVGRIAQSEIDGLRTSMWLREKDIAEKSDIYVQSKTDNNRLENIIGINKDLANKAIADTYIAGVRSDAAIVERMNDNRLESYRNVSDLYATTVKADKDLELQIEKNREIDQNEKFLLYKNLSDQTNCLAYKTMEQTYQNQIKSMQENEALAKRICALESKAAVNDATIPLYFQLANQTMLSTVERATCKKIDGNLTIDPSQICAGNFATFGWAPFGTPFGGNSGGCGCNNHAIV